MLFLIVIMNIFLALTFTLSKFVIASVNPLWFLTMRMVIGGLFFSGWFILSKEKVKITSKYVLTLGILAFLNVYLTNICQLWALESLSAAKTALLFNVNPFIIMLLGYLFLKEKISNRKIVGLIAGWLGLLVSLLQSGDGGLNLRIGLGEISILIAAAATAISAVILQKIMHDRTYPVTLTTGITMLVGGGLSASHALATHSPLALNVSASTLYAGIGVTVATIACAGLYSYLLKFYPASFISFTGFTAPLFAAGFDWLLFGSVVTWHFYVAMILIGLGLYIFYQDSSKTKYL